MELGDAKIVWFKWPSGYNLEFKTGQFITVSWPDAPSQRRAYPVCSPALDRGCFDVAVKREGKMGTHVVDGTMIGDHIGRLLPARRFWSVRESGKHLTDIANDPDGMTETTGQRPYRP